MAKFIKVRKSRIISVPYGEAVDNTVEDICINVDSIVMVRANRKNSSESVIFVNSPLKEEYVNEFNPVSSKIEIRESYQTVMDKINS